MHDLWRLQQLGYDVYRVNTHVNREAQVATALAVIGGLEGEDPS